MSGPAEWTLDGVLAGQMPEALGRALGEHKVVERVVAEWAATADVGPAIVSGLESERTAQVVDEVVRSPAFGRLLRQAVEATLTDELVGGLFANPAFHQAVSKAIAQQSTSLGGEVAAAGRRRGTRADSALERGPRRLFRRSPRTGPVPDAGIATRGVGLVLDAGIVALTFLVGAALVGLVSSLVGHLRPHWLVGTITGSAWVLLEVIYFVGFWAAGGQTPGMRLMRVRIRTRANEAPGVGRSLVRFVGLVLAIIPCFAGFLPVLVDERRRGLHDFIAGTVVVYDGLPDAEPAAAAPTAEPAPTPV